MNLTKKYYSSHLKNELKHKLEFYDEDSFYLDLLDGEGKSVGKVRLGLSILPMFMANKNKAGQGRSEPNQGPFLGPPVGRVSLSINPFKMIVNPRCSYSVEPICASGTESQTVYWMLLACMLCSLHCFNTSDCRESNFQLDPWSL